MADRRRRNRGDRDLAAKAVALVALAACAGSAEESAVAPRPTITVIGSEGEVVLPGAGAEPRPPRRDVFSLIDNRMLAHPQRGGGLVVNAGSAGFAKYTRFSKPKPVWKLRQEVDGVRVAVPQTRAGIDVPLTREQAAQPVNEIALRVHAKGSNRVVVSINGKEAGGKGNGGVELRFGWQTIAVRAEPGQLVAGENTIDLAFRGGGVAIAWLQVGGPAMFEPEHERAPAVYDAAAEALVVRDGAGLAWYVAVPAGATVEADVVGDGCIVDVAAAAHDGARATGLLRGAGAAVELAPVAGRVARVELTARGCPEARLARAALRVPGAAPEPREVEPPRYVIWWVMDTLRADRIPLFSPGARAEVPNLEKLAARGAVFRNAYVQGNESQASHASMWTSVYPEVHDINITRIGGTWQLHDELTKLGEQMKAAGFYTVGSSANGFITRPARYGAGFDDYDNPMRDGYGKRVNGKVPSDVVVGRAMAHLQPRFEKTREPWFLFLGTIDTHKPWIARDPWIERYHPDPYKGKYKRIIWGGDVGVEAGRMISRVPQTATDLRWIFALYDCGVSYQDEWVGKVAAQLEAWGVLDDTLWIITADHGEEIAEKGRIGHGGSLAEVLVHVPMLVSYPKLFPDGGVVIDEGADTIDLLPTLLELLGGEVPGNVQGESLVPMMQGRELGYPRPAISSMYTLHHGMNLGGWKLIAKRKQSDNQLYDLVHDVPETRNLIGERPIELRFTTDALSLFTAYVEDWRKASWGVASNLRPGIYEALGE